MYRYLDLQGHVQRLANEEELRIAIAAGRVRRITPFAVEGEALTAAGKHPAFQRHSVKSQKSSVNADPAGNSRYRKIASVAGPLLALALGVYARRDDFKGGDHDAFMAAVSAAAEGQAIPEAFLSSPPSRYADRMVWVVIAASHDAEQEMTAAEQRYGVLEMPGEWMRPGYLLNASRYPHVAQYLDAMQRFHTTYRDSLVLIAERALRRRAGDAELKERDLEAILAENRSSSRQVITYYDLLTQWAREARRLHGVLVAAAPNIRGVRGDQIFFTSDYSRNQYQSTLQRLQAIEARRDTLEHYIQQSSQDDFAKLTGN